MSQATKSDGFAASQRTGRTLLELALLLGALVGLFFVSRSVVGCVAERAALALPPALDVRIGEVAGAAVRKGHTGAAPAPEARARVEGIFNELVHLLTPAELAGLGTPAITVLNDETPNAFALPGGQVFVQTGLLDRVGEGPDGAAQLRGALAHELGHAVARHALRLLARRMAFGLVIGLVMGQGDGLTEALLAGASQLEGLKNNRDMETEADAFGVALMRRGGYEPEGLAKFLETLGSQPVPELLSTHPDPANRAARIRANEQKR